MKMVRRDHQDGCIVWYLFRGSFRLKHIIVCLMGVIVAGICVSFIISNYLLSRHMVVIEVSNSGSKIRPELLSQVSVDDYTNFEGLPGADGYNIPFFEKTYKDLKWNGPTNVNWTQNDETLRLCPAVPPKLGGFVRLPRHPKTFLEIEKLFPNLEKGGHYKPTGCGARHRIAIIIPFRDREKHLKMFLEHMHRFLQKQQLDYVIFVVELVHGVPFNRALLMNIGYAEAVKLYDFQCFVFHDIDLLPENDRNLYTCPRNPRHLSVAVSTMNYKLPYPQICGGAVSMTKDHFEQINGFSNLFFGWGGEDDDLYNRIQGNGLHLSRYTAEIARYKMLSHKKDVGNPLRFKLLDSGFKRWKQDGINSLNYKRLKIDFFPLYTKILVAYPTLNATGSNRNKKLNLHKLQESMIEYKSSLKTNISQNDMRNSVTLKVKGTMNRGDENSAATDAGDFINEKDKNMINSVAVSSPVAKVTSELTNVEDSVENTVGNSIGNSVRSSVENTVGNSVRNSVGNTVGNMTSPLLKASLKQTNSVSIMRPGDNIIRQTEENKNDFY